MGCGGGGDTKTDHVATTSHPTGINGHRPQDDRCRFSKIFTLTFFLSLFFASLSLSHSLFFCSVRHSSAALHETAGQVPYSLLLQQKTQRRTRRPQQSTDTDARLGFAYDYHFLTTLGERSLCTLGYALTLSDTSEKIKTVICAAVNCYSCIAVRHHHYHHRRKPSVG